MSDILLIQPPIGSPELYNRSESKLDAKSYSSKTRCTRVPQNLLSLATILDYEDYHVDIFDCRLYYGGGHENYLKILKARIKNARLLIGISVMTPYIAQTLEIIEAIKEVNPKIPIVLGGIHPTLYPQQTCQDKDVDFVICGDGEYPLLELANALDNNHSFKNIKGLTYKKDNAIITNPIGKPFDINESPKPAYHLLEMESYLTWVPYYSEKRTIGLDYLMTRGCPFNCSFCVNNFLPQSRTWKFKTPDKVIEELHTLKEKYKFDYIYFEDDNAFLNRKNSVEIAKRLIKEDFNIHYLATIRVDTLLNTPREDLEIIKKSGWSETIVGIESGSDKTLEFLKKGITVEQILKAVKILKELDIWTAYNFMTCIPTETREHRIKTYKIMRKIKQIHPKSLLVGPHLFRPFPGSKLYSYCISGGFREPKTFREWANSPLYNTENASNLAWVHDYPFTEKFESYLQIYSIKELFKKAVKSTIWRMLELRSFKENKW